jgi:hypothetical protein
MVEVYRQTSRHIKSIFNASVTRFITGHLLTLLSLYINWYLYSTINKLYLLVYPGNQMKYLKVYNLQTCNLLIYTNATGSCFCFYYANVKNFDNAEHFHFFSDPGPVCYHISLVLTYFLLVRKEIYMVL